MTQLDITRVLPGSLERLWHAWTDAQELASWFWPPRFETTAFLDLRNAGALRIRSDIAGIGVSGVFTELEPNRRLQFTWRWDGEDSETLVTVDFTASENNTTGLRIVHERFEDAEAASEHVTGWNDCLDRLATALARPVRSAL